eukprot:753497-Hanusia_phi.AAC.2
MKGMGKEYDAEKTREGREGEGGGLGGRGGRRSRRKGRGRGGGGANWKVLHSGEGGRFAGCAAADLKLLKPSRHVASRRTTS